MPEPSAAAPASPAPELLWSRTCERLAAEMPEPQFNQWIRPHTAAVEDEAGQLAVRLTVPNRFFVDWIRAQYAARIEGLASELAGRSVRLELQVAPRAPQQGAVGAYGQVARQPAAPGASPAASERTQEPR
ncbi:MAG: chromosomal replication initiator protein DnaA, partial [Burkholderiales bacterium]|nr:chromosomal replication initiator protein DnaA [Burkholderiales bacterium]